MKAARSQRLHRSPGELTFGSILLRYSDDTASLEPQVLKRNDASLVRDDLDPVLVARRVFDAAMLNSGQICLDTKRAYVPRAMYDDFCDELARLAEAAAVGDGLDPDTEFGPIQNAAQFEKAKGYLEIAHQDGTVIAGGAALDRPGYFIAPTIERVNDSPCGWAGVVWGRDTERANAVAMRINSGIVWVNQHLVTDPAFTTGGAKQSGDRHRHQRTGDLTPRVGRRNVAG